MIVFEAELFLPIVAIDRYRAWLSKKPDRSCHFNASSIPPAAATMAIDRIRTMLLTIAIGAAIESANTLTGSRSNGLDPEALMPLYRDDQFIHMLPNIDFEEQRRFRSGSQGGKAIDYLASNIVGESD